MTKTKTPYRYPGAKNRLLDKIIPHIEYILDESDYYIEPFVGGGSVFLEILSKDRFSEKKFVINDKDKSIYAFWKVVSDKNKINDLKKMVSNTNITVEEHKKQKQKINSNDIVECAYASLFLNRTSFSGIMTSGPIGGKKQEGKWKIGCRYNADAIIKKIDSIHQKMISVNVSIYNEGFESIIYGHEGLNCAYYCDPPYVKKGNSLYRHGMTTDDHFNLMLFLERNESKFVLSYDDTEEIRNLYSHYKTIDTSAEYSISGKNRESWDKKNELIIVGV